MSHLRVDCVEKQSAGHDAKDEQFSVDTGEELLQAPVALHGHVERKLQAIDDDDEGDHHREDDPEISCSNTIHDG